MRERRNDALSTSAIEDWYLIMNFADGTYLKSRQRGLRSPGVALVPRESCFAAMELYLAAAAEAAAGEETRAFAGGWDRSANAPHRS